jgi:azurin
VKAVIGAVLGLVALNALPANAGVCRVSVEANDMMQFNQKRLDIEPACTDVELTLKHVGKQPAQVMGHNWVLVRTPDLMAVAMAGQNAGRAHNYQPPGDKRIIAATSLVGGGESAVVTFSTSNLHAGETYSFFCSTPGHGAVMRGALVFGRAGDPDVAMTKDAKGQAAPATRTAQATGREST